MAANNNNPHNNQLKTGVNSGEEMDRMCDQEGARGACFFNVFGEQRVKYVVKN